jgi:hypothetical protein
MSEPTKVAKVFGDDDCSYEVQEALDGSDTRCGLKYREEGHGREDKGDNC